LVFEEKNANFFAENWQKSQKILITTPDICFDKNLKDVIKFEHTACYSGSGGNGFFYPRRVVCI
jgi:hypothetical protein